MLNSYYIFSRDFSLFHIFIVLGGLGLGFGGVFGDEK
jgi:hypothetical protein